MSTKIFTLLALTSLTLALPSPGKTLPISKRQDATAALAVNPFTCLNGNRLAGACCMTNENPDYTNYYCAAPTGTSVPGVAGAYICPTTMDDRAVSSWCCSTLDHGSENDGYTLWCEDGIAGQLIDTTSLSTSSLSDPSLASLTNAAAVESALVSLENALSLDTSTLDSAEVQQAIAELESELSLDPSTLDASALGSAIEEIGAALAGTPLSTDAFESAIGQLEGALSSSPVDAEVVESAVAEVEEALAPATAV